MATKLESEASRETVYAAIELSKKTWVLGIALPDRDRPSIHRITGGNLGELVARLRVAAREDRRILVCYEAGYDGFWLARALAELGIECRVLDPASIQVNRRARRVKTDRIDVLALLRALIAIDRGERHVCAVVRVPSVEEEDARRSHRERQRLVRERTGHINRIKGLLFAQGIRGIEPKLRRTQIDFAALETGEGHPLAQRLRCELEREYARLDLVETQLREVEKDGAAGYKLMRQAHDRTAEDRLRQRSDRAGSSPASRRARIGQDQAACRRWPPASPDRSCARRTEYRQTGTKKQRRPRTKHVRLDSEPPHINPARPSIARSSRAASRSPAGAPPPRRCPRRDRTPAPHSPAAASSTHRSGIWLG